MNKSQYFAISIILLIFTGFSSSAQLCKDYMIWDGSEKLATFGMDTTDNWWAITKPFTTKFRLVVNGIETDSYDDLTIPKFSPDGMKWACFGKYGGQWYLLNEEYTMDIPAFDIGEIVYSGNSEVLVYSYFKSELEIIEYGDKKVEVMNRSSSIFTDFYGKKVAFTGKRGRGTVINIDGRESTIYDDIIPIGFWHDGDMVYGAKNGNQWQILKGETPISSYYRGIKITRINRFGTAVAVVAVDYAGRNIAYLYSDEFNEPVISRSYEYIDNLALHPSLPLMAYTAAKPQSFSIVYNTTEYNAGDIYGRPQFTSDGEDMYFAGCDFDCFINVNGRRHVLKHNINVDLGLAKKSGSETIAYSTSSNLILLHLKLGSMHAGMMVDETLPPRYNWRDDRYEAIGRIYDRLYLLTCRPQ